MKNVFGYWDFTAGKHFDVLGTLKMVFGVIVHIVREKKVHNLSYWCVSVSGLSTSKGSR